MKIIRKGDVFLFECPSCKCYFAEGVNNTQVAHAGVGGCNGVYHNCPECGESVLGKRRHPNGDLRKTIPEEVSDEE